MPPVGGDFAELVETLNFLREGRPIGGRDKYGLIRQVGGEARSDFSNRVIENTTAGPQGASHSTWLIANYGGGKSETLRQMQDALDERRFGNYQILVCWVDLNVDSSTTAAGFQLALFYNSSFLSPRDTSREARDLAKKLLEANPNPTKGAENVIGIGLDLATTALDVSAPGSGILANSLLGKAWRSYYQRPGYIRKAIEKLNLADARATELMIHWIRYSLWPSEKKWRALEQYIEGLAEARALFPVMTHVLNASSYASVVILIDQAEKLIGNRILTDTLMNIHAPEGHVRLNLFFVFAGTAEVESLKSEVEYGGFFRRFLDPRQCSSVHANLESPEIRPGRNDDIERIGAALAQIKQRHVGIPIPDLDNRRISEIRRELTQQATRGRVTWPMLWRAMLSDAPEREGEAPRRRPRRPADRRG